MKTIPAARGPGPVEESLLAGTIVHIGLPAGDRVQAGRFYHKVFGWEVLDVPEWDYSLFEAGAPPGGGLGTGLLPEEFALNGALPFILVDSIEEALGRITAEGGRVLLPKKAVPGTGWLAIFRDPEGTILALWERAPKAGWPYWRQDILRTALEDGG